MEWYCILGICAYSIFIIKVVLAIFGAEFDFDFDGDGVVDMDLGSIVSFKGLLHFILGFSTWLMANDHWGVVTTKTYIAAVVIGILTTVVLFFIYKLVLKAETIPAKLSGKQLVGRRGVVTGGGLLEDDHFLYIVALSLPYGTQEIMARSETVYKEGDPVKLKKEENGIYFI